MNHHKTLSKCVYRAQPRSWAIKVMQAGMTWDGRKCSKSIQLGNRRFCFFRASDYSTTLYLVSSDGEWEARLSNHWAWRVGKVQTFSCHKVSNSYIDIGTPSNRGIKGLRIHDKRHAFVLGIRRRFVPAPATRRETRRPKQHCQPRKPIYR